jgi:hypothetical protein
MKFPYATTRQIGRTILILKKNSPHLFFAGGLLGSVTSTVLACRATLKLESTVDEIKDDIKEVKARRDNPGLATLVGRDYTERDYIHDITYVYGKSAKRLIKLYGPSVVLGVASAGALTGSHVQLTRRNSALTATAAALSKAYDDYRERVRAEVGEDKELALHRAITEQKVEIDGKKETVSIVDPNGLSAYSRVFDEVSPEWQKDAELNYIFVKTQQNYANHLLQARGHVFLNEIYDALGLERSRAGAVVGWVLNGEGDGHIDFGLHLAHNAKFVDGNERSAWLDFNVDGIIYDKI